MFLSPFITTTSNSVRGSWGKKSLCYVLYVSVGAQWTLIEWMDKWMDNGKEESKKSRGTK